MSKYRHKSNVPNNRRRQQRTTESDKTAQERPETYQEEDLRERKRLVRRQGQYVGPFVPPPPPPPPPPRKPDRQPEPFEEQGMKKSLFNKDINRAKPPYPFKPHANKGLGMSAPGMGASVSSAYRTAEAADESDSADYNSNTFSPMPIREGDEMGMSAFSPMPMTEQPRPPEWLEVDEQENEFYPMGKQENNRKWSYGNWRSKQNAPVPEDREYIFNDLFEHWDKKRPVMGRDGNPTEIAMWERNVRRSAAEQGLSEEEIERLVQDLYDLR